MTLCQKTKHPYPLVIISSNNNINILTHTQDGKPLQRDITKDFVANFKYHAAFLFSNRLDEWANLYTNI